MRFARRVIFRRCDLRRAILFAPNAEICDRDAYLSFSVPLLFSLLGTKERTFLACDMQALTRKVS